MLLLEVTVDSFNVSNDEVRSQLNQRLTRSVHCHHYRVSCRHLTKTEIHVLMVAMSWYVSCSLSTTPLSKVTNSEKSSAPCICSVRTVTGNKCFLLLWGKWKASFRLTYIRQPCSANDQVPEPSGGGTGNAPSPYYGRWWSHALLVHNTGGIDSWGSMLDREGDITVKYCLMTSWNPTQMSTVKDVLA